MVTILYRPESEHERKVREFLHELIKNQVVTKLVNIDSREGTALAQLYDIVRYPGIILTAEDGRLIKSWDGKLPLLSDVTYTSRI